MVVIIPRSSLQTTKTSHLVPQIPKKREMLSEFDGPGNISRQQIASFGLSARRRAIAMSQDYTINWDAKMPEHTKLDRWKEVKVESLYFSM